MLLKESIMKAEENVYGKNVKSGGGRGGHVFWNEEAKKAVKKGRLL